MKKAILVTLLASTLGLGAAAAVQADNTSSENGKGYSKQDGGKHHGKRGGKRGGGKMMKRMAKKLNLTEAQQTQLSNGELAIVFLGEKRCLIPTEIGKQILAIEPSRIVIISEPEEPA